MAEQHEELGAPEEVVQALLKVDFRKNHATKQWWYTLNRYMETATGESQELELESPAGATHGSEEPNRVTLTLVMETMATMQQQMQQQQAMFMRFMKQQQTQQLMELVLSDKLLARRRGERPGEWLDSSEYETEEGGKPTPDMSGVLPCRYRRSGAAAWTV